MMDNVLLLPEIIDRDVWFKINDDYEINQWGEIYSLNYRCTGKRVKKKQCKGKKGYMSVGINNKTKFTHRLLAEACFGRCPDGYEVNHKNFKRDENTYINIEYIPISKNRATHSEKAKAKMSKMSSQQMTNNRQNDVFNKNNAIATSKHCKIAFSKPVLQFDAEGNFIREWASTMEIQRTLGYASSNISAYCRGKKKTAYGFIWKYKEVV